MCENGNGMTIRTDGISPERSYIRRLRETISHIHGEDERRAVNDVGILIAAGNKKERIVRIRILRSSPEFESSLFEQPDHHDTYRRGMIPPLCVRCFNPSCNPYSTRPAEQKVSIRDRRHGNWL